ncbi:MAG: protein-glutamate O-methyltransferase CheR [Bryobacteraceae bacterium]|nr:protein-glutamate O-methyltransferase CheR [Bryobacteraceae bacterium]
MKQPGGMQGAAAGLGEREFRELRELARRTFGLDLKPGKEALVHARLARRVQELGLGSIAEYIEAVKADRTGLELERLINALATNHTSFLREPQHFALLRERILPELAPRASFWIWSAGCSTGEEPYTILFTAAERLGARIGAMRLLATDISTRALEKAQAAIYPAERLQGLPPGWPQKYFQRGTGRWEGSVRVKPEWRARVDFRRLNLMEDFSFLPRMAVIFCRNVMIYFDKATQERLVRRFEDRLEPGGWLLIGHSEGLMGVRHGLEYVMPAVYRKPAA